GNTIGAFIFGLGMVLAGGCASGITYRSAEGMTTAWMAGITFALTATATKKGILSFIPKSVESFTKTVEHTNQIYKQNSGLTLADVFNLDPLVMAIIFAAILWIYTFATKTTQRETKFSWKVAAVLLAVLAPFAWLTSQNSGRMYGLGITGGWINIIDTITSVTSDGKLKQLNWEGWEIIGILIGAGISAALGKEFKLRMPKNPKTYLQVILGGILMGFGAAFADGCNIGHALTGVSLMAVSSIVATVFFMLGNWTMAWFLFGRK
ncbi:MAG: YeeE/YedE family protein, partial [Fervidobacterium pennivorans]